MSAETLRRTETMQNDTHGNTRAKGERHSMHSTGRMHLCALTQGLQGVLSTGGERERGAVRRHNESGSNTEANQETDGSR